MEKCCLVANTLAYYNKVVHISIESFYNFLVDKYLTGLELSSCGKHSSLLHQMCAYTVITFYNFAPVHTRK